MTNLSLRTATLVLLYFLTGRFGLMFPACGSHTTLIWLPTGIAVAALLRWGFKCWPGVTLGALAVTLSLGLAMPVALAIALGNTAAPLLAAWLLQRAKFHPILDRQRDILLLAVAAAIGMLVSATIGVTMLTMANELSDGWIAAWLAWWAGDFMGVIAAAPLFLAFSRVQWRTIAIRRGEFIIWILTMSLVAFATFVLNGGPNHEAWSVAFLPLPLVAWAAFRFRSIGTSLAVIVLSFTAIYGTSIGAGPLHRSNPLETLTVAWLYMATSAALGWTTTALHAARGKARGVQSLLEQAMHDASLGLLLANADRKITYANAGFTKLTGYTEEEILEKSCSILHGPDTDTATVAKIRTAVQGDGYFNGEVLNYRKDGTIFWNSLLLSPTHDDCGEITGFFGIQTDITKRKKAEVALKASVEFSDRLTGSMQDGLSVVDLSGVHQDVNPAFCRMTGFSREELVGVGPPHPYWPPEDYDLIEDKFSETLKGGTCTFELDFMRKNGERFPVIISPYSLKDENGTTINYLATVKDITDRKRVEEELSIATQKLRLHFEQTPMAAIEWDLNFRVTRWNPAAHTIFGFSEDEAIGQHGAFVVPEEFRAHVDQVWESLLSKSGGERSSNKNVRKDGRTIVCEWYNTLLVDDQDEVTGIASLVMDITERRQAQKLLAWETSAMELIGSAAPLSDVLEGLMLGLEEQTPRALCSILLLDDDGIHLRHGAAPSLPTAYNRAIDGVAIGPQVGSCGTAAYFDRQIIVAEIGTDPLWAPYCTLAMEHDLHACWSTPIHGHHGKILGTFAIYYREKRSPSPSELDLISRATHITGIAIERKDSEEAMRESEEKFRSLFENASDAIFLTQDNQFIDCNPRTLEMFGCKNRDQIIGQPPYEFSPSLQPSGLSSREMAIEKMTAALAGEPQFFEWMHTRLDGSLFPAEVSLNTVTLKGQILIQAIVRDISERAEAEEKILELNATLEDRVELRTDEMQTARKAADEAGELLDRFFQMSLDMWCVAGIDGYFKKVNPAFSENLGISDYEFLNRPFVDFVHPDDVKATVAAVKQLASGESLIRFQNRYRVHTGGYLWLEWCAVPDIKGELIYAAARNVTDRKAMEDELRRSNAELEQFAHVASHDLQEPLRMVTSFVQLLQRRYRGKLGDDADEYIHHVVDGTERMRRLILALLELSGVERKGRPMGEVDANVALDTAIENLDVLISESGAEIHREELPVVSVDSEQLIQLFQNLLSNAIKYKDQGSPVIDIGAIEENGMWIFSVEDNGPGIAPEHREQIFQIFQRLKLRQDVSGTGIGLAICRRIVTRHGGKIWMEEGGRGGAAFRFSLPGVPARQEN